MIDREQALKLLMDSGQEPQLLHHALMTEAVLTALADRLQTDRGLWGLTGLLHDLDYPKTKDSPGQHGLLSAELLTDKLPEPALNAIRAHNSEHTKISPESPLDFALRCGESVTGLVATNALVRPEGLHGMTPKSLKKKMKDKAFAAAVRRENILECDRIGLTLDEFFTLAIAAISSVADQVGLRSSS